MIPTPFKEQNMLLGAGNNENTSDLPVAVSLHAEDSHPTIISCWKLSPEEIAQVNEKGCIYIGVVGHSHPPIVGMALNPFSAHGYVPVDITGHDSAEQ